MMEPVVRSSSVADRRAVPTIGGCCRGCLLDHGANAESGDGAKHRQMRERSPVVPAETACAAAACIDLLSAWHAVLPTLSGSSEGEPSRQRLRAVAPITADHDLPDHGLGLWAAAASLW